MKKINIKMALKNEYTASQKEVSLIDIPKLSYLALQGIGNPNTSPMYQEVIEALYAVAYTIKFKIKKEKEIDFGVMPLETLWWLPDGEERMEEANKSNWCWESLIMQPAFIDEQMVCEVIEEVSHKKKLVLDKAIKLKTLEEGLVMQIMHKGPYDEEQEQIALLHQAIQEKGYRAKGLHHEIYLNDPRRTLPNNLKTIIRQPVSLSK
ncbi:MAG: GyrI-like domain-containing protein [Niameybacter sp.]